MSGIAFSGRAQTRATTASGWRCMLETVDRSAAAALTFAQPVAVRERFWDRTKEFGAMQARQPGRAIAEYSAGRVVPG
jgi:hypothetical protein